LKRTEINRTNPSLSIRWLSFLGLEGKFLNAFGAVSAFCLIKITLLDGTLFWWSPRYKGLAVVVALIGLTLSILVHELGHASFVLLRRGRVAVEVSPGIGLARPEDEDQIHSFLVIIAGPIASFALGVALIELAKFSRGYVPFLEFHSILFFLACRIIYWLGVINVLLAITNLLPVWPLDGYRLGEACIARLRWGHTRARARVLMATFGMIIAFALLVISLRHPVAAIILSSASFLGLSVLNALDCYSDYGVVRRSANKNDFDLPSRSS